MSPTIRCPNCNGKGEAKLPPALKRCFNAIVKLGRPSIKELHGHLGEDIDTTAVNQRVSRLITLKLVRNVNGSDSARRYSATKPHAASPKPVPADRP